MNLYQIAARLISEDGENPEYDRGVASLLAEIDPTVGRTASDRTDDVLETLRVIQERGFDD